MASRVRTAIFAFLLFSLVIDIGGQNNSTNDSSNAVPAKAETVSQVLPDSTSPEKTVQGMVFILIQVSLIPQICATTGCRWSLIRGVGQSSFPYRLLNNRKLLSLSQMCTAGIFLASVKPQHMFNQL